MSSSIFHDKIPHSILFPSQPLFCLPPRVFGCVCFVHILILGQDKLSSKATKCVFLGYSQLQRGYHCYYPNTHRYFVSADVTFFENSFMFPITHPSSSYVISLPLIYPVLDTSPIPPATPPRPLQVILIARVLTLGLQLTHLLWHPPPRCWSCRLLLIFPLPFEKVLVPLVTPILFIISLLIILYLPHTLPLFPPCLLFMFHKLCMRLYPIQTGNRLWLRK